MGNWRSCCLVCAVLVLGGLAASAGEQVDYGFRRDEAELDRTSTVHPISYAGMIERVIPAVVSVFPMRLITGDERSREELLERYFRGGRKREDEEEDEHRELGAGSGVIVSPKGYILTNAHVLERVGEDDEVMVELSDRRRVKAEIVGLDRKTDVGVLKIPAPDAAYLPFTDSDLLKPGDRVFAVGNPFKLGHTTTAGIISALDRTGLDLIGGGYERFIQTDTPINPGNSGGALIDVKGRLVGINTAIVGPGGNIGIGFAVPANLALRVLEMLVRDGQVRRGFAGVRVADVEQEDFDTLGLPAVRGVKVEGLAPEGPAEQAGLQVGDVILKVGPRVIRDRGDFRVQVAYFTTPSEKVAVAVFRGGKELTLSLTVGEQGGQPVNEQQREELIAGVFVRPLARADRERLGLEPQAPGLLVVEVEEESEPAGKLKPDMLVVEINGAAATGLSDARGALRVGMNQFVVLEQGNRRHLVVPVSRLLDEL